jgi:hypothetical protein
VTKSLSKARGNCKSTGEAYLSIGAETESRMEADHPKKGVLYPCRIHIPALFATHQLTSPQRRIVLEV